MHDYVFYLSYARLDSDPSLVRFFLDLQKEVQMLTGCSAVGFMDQRSIEVAEPFEQQIAAALGRSAVLLALYSPAYFRSEFCGKEWTVFLSRRPTISQPPGILPVLWSPWRMLRDVPQIAKQLSHSDPRFPDIYEKQGLRYILRLKKHDDDYAELLHHLAQLVIQTAETAALPPLVDSLLPSRVASAFRLEPTPPADRQSETLRSPKVQLKTLRAFLCHSSGDKPRVRDLCSKLAASGVDPWLDENNLLPGQDWNSEITKAVRKSDVVIVCFSRSSVTKAGYVQKEMRLALDVADEQPEGTMFLIPVRLEECDVPERFRHLHYANLFEVDGYTKLLNALQLRASEVTTRATTGA